MRKILSSLILGAVISSAAAQDDGISQFAENAAAYRATNNGPGPVTPGESPTASQPARPAAFPWEGTIALGTTLATILFGAKARRWGKIARAVIRGVEMASHQGVKEQIAAQSHFENVADELHREVKKLTRKKQGKLPLERV